MCSLFLPEETAMIYTDLTRKAMKLAYEAHHGQYDKSGVPYIFHPYHLAEQMDDEYSVCAALLHDVAEDTDITLDELAEQFPAQVINALRLLTHDDSEDYFAYVRKIRSDPIAVKVKLADLGHNSDQSRMEGCSFVSEEKKAALREKYSRAKAILLGRE